jgi:uncharacterized protein YndB with AHSA1/START domain
MGGPQKKSRSIWFNLLKWTSVLLVAAVVTLVGVGLFVLDGKYDVAREVTITAPPEAIHRQIGDLREWPNWLPFTKHDQSVQTTIDQPTGVGAHQHWTSKDGTGKLTFTASDEQKGIEYAMLFDEKWASQGSMTYARSGDATRVTWRMTGQNNDLMGKWMALLMGPMVGPMFEEGLADLKTKVEADLKAQVEAK